MKKTLDRKTLLSAISRIVKEYPPSENHIRAYKAFFDFYKDAPINSITFSRIHSEDITSSMKQT